MAEEQMAPVVTGSQTEVAPLQNDNNVTQPPVATDKTELSPQYASLARKETAIRNKVKEIKAREAAIAAKEAAYQKDYIPKDRLKSSTIEALAEVGVTMDELVKLTLKQAEHTADPVKAQIEALKAEIEALKQRSSEDQDASYKAALAQIKMDVDKMVAVDPAYEVVKARGAEQMVVDLIERVYSEDNQVLSNEEAAALVEDELLKEAEQLAKLSKVQKKLTAANSATAPAAADVTTQVPRKTAGMPAHIKSATGSQPSGMTTLTNKQTVTRQLTARERAILAFKGELK